jgi:periplasmic protein TonB
MIFTICLLALVVFVFSLDLSWTNVVSPRRNDLVFEGRVQEYGAYQLRKESHRSLFFAFLIVGGLASGVLYFLGGNGIATDYQPSSDLIDTWILPPICSLEIEKEEPKKEEDTPTEPRRELRGDNQAEPEVVENGATAVMTASTAISNPSGTSDDPDAGEISGPTEMPAGKNPCTVKPTEWVPWAQVMPEFPGGAPALYKFLSGHIDYPEFYRNRGIQGTVWITFVVALSGEVTQVEVERGIPGAPGLDKAALEAVKQMPHWIPGRNGEESVAVRQRIPVKFVLQSN